MISPLLSIVFFRYQKISGKQKGSFTKLSVSVLWDEKFRQNRYDAPPTHENFREKNFSETPKCSPMKYFVQWDKNFDGKWCYPPFLSIKYVSLPEIFWSTEWFPSEVFSVLWDKKNFDKTVKLPPLLCLKLFDTRILSKHRRVLLRILSALRDKDFSTEFSDIPFLCINFCDARNFLKHRSVPQRNFSVLWDKKFWTKSRDTPSFA